LFAKRTHLNFNYYLCHRYIGGMEIIMDIGLILKVAGVGVLVAVASQILVKSGKDEQAMLLTVAGVIVVMLMLVSEMGELISTVRSVFGL